MVEEARFWGQKGPALYAASVTSFVLQGQKLLWAFSSSLQNEGLINGLAGSLCGLRLTWPLCWF